MSEEDISQFEAFEVLDLRGTKCPLNFVKAALRLKKIPINEVLEVWIDAGSEAILNLPKSMQAEGHAIVGQESLEDDPMAVKFWIERLK